MKNLKEILLEGKGIDLDVTIYGDDFNNDFYNAIAEVAYGYSKLNKDVSEDDFDKAVKFFKEKFFIEPDNE